MEVDEKADKPVVACYCATFLKPEMVHIYRQITALRRFRPVVLAQKREEAQRYPFHDVIMVRKPATHFLRRVWYRRLRHAPWQISARETSALLHVLEQAEAKLLHVYFGHIAVHLRPLIERWERPSVVSFHGADVMVDLEKSAYRAATIRMLQAVRLVLVRSESLRDALVRLGCPPDKIRLQRTGIPLQQVPFQPRTWPADGAWRFLQAGRLIAKKGFHTSLRAFAEFRRRYANATLTLAGEGPLRGELETLARKLGIEGSVSFTGFVAQEKLRELFYQSHIFLHPSETGPDGNQEGVPNSMLEAMASGLPVFATRHGGIPEAIEDGLSGVLVAEGDAEALTRELLHAVQKPDLLASPAKEGAASVAANFEQQTQVRRLEEYYQEAINLS